MAVAMCSLRTLLSLFIWILLFYNRSVHGLLTIVPSNSATVLAQAVLSGNTAITLNSATYAGALASSGTYAAGPFGIHDGAIFTTGLAISALPGAGLTSSTNNLVAGSATLCGKLAAGAATFDASVLTLNVNLQSSIAGITLSFIFASAEYPKYDRHSQLDCIH